MSVWLVRAGKRGENEAFCLEQNVVGTGWDEISDLSSATDWDSIKSIVESVRPGPAVANYTGQLWRLRLGMQPNDTVVLPLKTTSQIAIGTIIGDYTYRSENPADRRHLRDVTWTVTDIPRSAIKQDLLNSLGSAMTICAIERNDAEWRIGEIAANGVDPGARPATLSATAPAPAVDEPDDTSPTGAVIDDIERYSKDRLMQLVRERFANHNMQELVAAILRAEGFQTSVPPKGPDQGIDVIAGSGPLGLDSPRIIVQVKSEESKVSNDVVERLQHAIQKHNADYGLLVAWGDVSGPAKEELRSNHFGIRVWNADQLLDAIHRTYERLPAAIQAEIPLKPVWVVVEEAV